MSFPRYPKYKDSGVEWLGEVPEGWEVKRSDSFLTYSRAQLDPIEFQGLEVFHYSIPVVQQIGTGQLEDGSELASGKQVVKKKVVLVSKLNPRKGTICIAEPQQVLTLCSTEFVALEPNGCDIRYLSYLVRTEGFRQGLESKVTSVTNSHQRANPADIYRFWNAWPALPEQTAIAEFLDRETGKIDELVAEQRRLMELLKEKRQAVISHTVTKGLNPHAPMKPSGIEWIGDVPEHWNRTRIKRTARPGNKTFVDGDWIETPYITTEGVRLLQCGNVGTGVFEEQGFRYISEKTFASFDCTEVEPGNVLICRLQSSRTILAGRACLAPNLGVKMITSVDNCIVKPSKDFDPRYIVYQLSTNEYLSFVEVVARGGTRDRVSRSMLGNIDLVAPPVGEQKEIADFIEAETAKFDTLTAEAQRAIDLLQERRTALISAAVTGQIDVRQPPKN